jgi:hypothetical protein
MEDCMKNYEIPSKPKLKDMKRLKSKKTLRSPYAEIPHKIKMATIRIT